MPGRTTACGHPRPGFRAPGKARMQLIPTGFSRSCSLRVIWVSSLISAAHDFVGRGLVHTAGVVVASPDSGDESGRWQEAVPAVRIHGQYSAANFESYPALSTRHSLICCALSPGGGSRMAIRSPINSQWAIMATCTDCTVSRSMAPRWYAVIRSGMQTMVISSIASRPETPLRSFDVADVVVAAEPRRRGRHRNGGRRRERDLHAGVKFLGGLAGDRVRASRPAMPR